MKDDVISNIIWELYNKDKFAGFNQNKMRYISQRF